MDSDLQPPETIADFAGKWREGHDVVFGMRRDRRAYSAWRSEGERWLPLKLARLAIDGVALFPTVPLIFSGVPGEYLGRVYEVVKERSLFLVCEESGRPLVAATTAAPLGSGLR